MSLSDKFRRVSRRMGGVIHASARIDRHVEDLKIGQGRMLARQNQQLNSSWLPDFEFKVFSQWGEDGIIQKLVRSVPIANRTFIEFGVEDFWESNCRFLLMKDNWSGFVIDGSPANVERIRSQYYFWKYDLRARAAFINAANIEDELAQSGFDEDLGILSIDVDGMDYHLLAAINRFRPRILICEYNSVFGPDRKITVPYSAGFTRGSAHYSHLYFGASLAAFADLAERKGYVLIGGTSEGVNAFFVRADLMGPGLEARTPGEVHVRSKLREGRDREGGMTYHSWTERQAEIAGLPVLNIETGEIEPF